MSTRDRRPFPTADEISERAHELFTSGGRRVAMIPEYWRAAERELLERAADRTIERGHPTSHTASRRRRTR